MSQETITDSQHNQPTESVLTPRNDSMTLGSGILARLSSGTSAPQSSPRSGTWPPRSTKSPSRSDTRFPLQFGSRSKEGKQKSIKKSTEGPAFTNPTDRETIQENWNEGKERVQTELTRSETNLAVSKGSSIRLGLENLYC